MNDQELAQLARDTAKKLMHHIQILELEQHLLQIQEMYIQVAI